MDHFVTLARAVVLVLLLFPLLPAYSVAAEARSGLGLQVAPLSSGEVVVLAVIEGSPAAEAGLRPGDVLLVVNDTPLAGRDFRMTARQFFWDETISAYRLTYARPGVQGTAELELERAPVLGEPVALPGTEMLAPETVQSGGEQ